MTVTRPHPGRPVGADGKQTRGRIIAAAMRCVAEMGYSQTTIRAIARIADMTSGSLYHYFPNKSELLDAAVREVDEIALPRLGLAAARADADDVVGRFEALLDELDRLMRDYPHLAAFDRAVSVECKAHPRAEKPPYPGLKALRDIIGDIVDDAALPPCTDKDATADVVYALTRGLTERAASLSSGAYAATLASAKGLLRGTLFTRPPGGSPS